jgi:copper chaperone CopZ
MNSTTTKQVYRIGVAGMDCSACEKLLIKQVKKVSGISASFADSDAGSLTIFADPDVSVEALSAAIVLAGFIPQGLDGQEHRSPPRSKSRSSRQPGRPMPWPLRSKRRQLLPYPSRSRMTPPSRSAE